MRMIWPFFFKPVIFLGIKEKYVQSQFNSFSLFYHRFTDSLSAKLCIVIRTVYRRNVLKYDDMIFLSYCQALGSVHVTTAVAEWPSGSSEIGVTLHIFSV